MAEQTGSGMSRRQLMRRAGTVVAGASGVAASGANAPAAADDGKMPEWTLEQGAEIADDRYGNPSPFEKSVGRRATDPLPFPGSGSIKTPLQDLSGIITPNGLHYVRNHAGTPEIDPARHRLLVHGMVERPLSFGMEVKSVITRPSPGRGLAQPGFREVTGLAWSGHGRITRVEVSADGGANWRDAALQEPVLPKCLSRFRLPWNWEGGPAVLQSRATDETGAVQPTRDVLVARRGPNFTYHYNAIQAWTLAPNGEVKLAV